MNRNTNVMLKLCTVFLMGTAGFFVSCQNELNVPVETFAPHEHPLSFTATIGVSTRASVDNYFEEFDRIMIQNVDFYEGGMSPEWVNKVGRYSYSAGDIQLLLSSSYWFRSDECKLIRAWHYGDEQEEWREYLPTAWREYLPTASTPLQVSVTQNERADYIQSDFIYARTTATYTTRAIPLSFYHQVAKVVVNVSSEGFAPDAEITGIDLEDVYVGGEFQEPALPDSPDTPVLGTWTTVGDKAQKIAMYKLETPNTADFENNGSVETAKASYAAIVIPQVDDSPEKLITIHANVDGTARELDWKSGMTHTYNLTLRGPGLVVSFEEESLIWTDGNSGSGSVALP